jgi:hypothetical protein
MLTAEVVGAEIHVVIQVDPSYPDRWREQPYREDIQNLVSYLPPSQRLFVRVKYRLIEIRATGELDHGEVPMAGWTDHKNATLAKTFHRMDNSFVRNQESPE